jgi:hypothetical protein
MRSARASSRGAEAALARAVALAEDHALRTSKLAGGGSGTSNQQGIEARYAIYIGCCGSTELRFDDKRR